MSFTVPAGFGDQGSSCPVERRIAAAPERGTPPPAEKPERRPEPYVSWSNHLDSEANLVRQRQEAAARAGDPPTARLDPGWRDRMEDVLWALLTSPEFVYRP